MQLLDISPKEVCVGAYMLQAGLRAEMGDVSLHTKNYFHFRLYQASADLFSSFIRVTALKSKLNSCIWYRYIISLALYVGTLMLFWQKLKVSAIYRPVQKLTGIKFPAGANLMPFFFCNQGSKHTHTFL